MFAVELLTSLAPDARALYVTRSVRLFAYGLISVLLFLFLKELGFRDDDVGYFLTLTLVGDAAVGLLITAAADQVGRRRMLLLGSVLMLVTGVGFALYPTFEQFDRWISGDTSNDPELDLDGWKGWLYFLVLLTIGVIGVISPSGNECGPFLALEQSVISQLSPPENRATLFAWYGFFGSVSTATGSLISGTIISHLTEDNFFATYFSLATTTFSDSTSHTMNNTIPMEPPLLMSKIGAYRVIIALYGICGTVLAIIFFRLSQKVESNESLQLSAIQRHEENERDHLLGSDTESNASSTRSTFSGFNLSPETRWKVLKLSLLFTLDAFGANIMTGSMLAYWFKYKYNVDEAYLGKVLFISNILAGFSAIGAGLVSQRIGLVNTMVFTHLPANLLMMIVPFAPGLFWATTVYFIRACISQMDVGPRQAYVVSVVSPSERTVVIGIVNTARSIGAAFGPMLTGWMAQRGYFDWCFVVCGGLTAMYDILLLLSFGGKRRTSGSE
ncbi:hypothetical protein HDU84_008459 [Entophlyctis sp. JEL0112]|nr:hypothetical protein HDU84_008459 [Entophlyctis sp. JEL0112]